MSWLSDYGNEYENLFIQNEFRILIHDIMDPFTGHHYGSILNCLRIIDRITTGNVAIESNKDIYQVSDSNLLLIRALIENQLSQFLPLDGYKELKSLSKYGKNLVNEYFKRKRTISIGWEMQQYPRLWNIFCTLNNNGLGIKQLNVLFPNCTEIAVNGITNVIWVPGNNHDHKKTHEFCKATIMNVVNFVLHPDMSEPKLERVGLYYDKEYSSTGLSNILISNFGHRLKNTNFNMAQIKQRADPNATSDKNKIDAGVEIWRGKSA
eukprot:539803_1